MFDDLRQQADETSYDELEESESETEEEAPQKKLRLPSLPTFGFTPQQRFIIALLLLIITFLMSSLILLFTGKIAIPFF